MRGIVAVATRSRYQSGQLVVTRTGNPHPWGSEQVGQNVDMGAWYAPVQV